MNAVPVCVPGVNEVWKHTGEYTVPKRHHRPGHHQTIGKHPHRIVDAILLGNNQAFEPSNKQILSISPEKFATNLYLNK